MIRITAQSSRQHVVPVRFTRAIHGPSEFDAPEVDDRGYFMGTRPRGWSETNVRGPMVGLMLDEGMEIRLKVLREDIDPTAPLFVTSSAPDGIEVTAPAGGGPLPEDGIFKVKAKSEVDGVLLEVRLGSAEGPAIAALEPHVFPPLRINITPHLVQIDGSGAVTGTAPTLPSLGRILRRTRKIWRPAGVVFRIQATVNDTITLPAGLVDTVNIDNNPEITALLRLQRTRLGLAAGTRDSSLNLYIVRQFASTDNSGTFQNPDGTLGVGISREWADDMGSPDTGIMLATRGINSNADIENAAVTVAHEIGHFFRLHHVRERHGANPVSDTYGRRQLLFPNDGYRNDGGSPVDDVGYGRWRPGCLISVKDLGRHSTDGETNRARSTIRSGNWT